MFLSGRIANGALVPPRGPELVRQAPLWGRFKTCENVRKIIIFTVIMAHSFPHTCQDSGLIFVIYADRNILQNRELYQGAECTHDQKVS